MVGLDIIWSQSSLLWTEFNKTLNRLCRRAITWLSLRYWNKFSDTPEPVRWVITGLQCQTDPSYVFPIDFHLKDISGIMKERRNHNMNMRSDSPLALSSTSQQNTSQDSQDRPHITLMSRVTPTLPLTRCMGYKVRRITSIYWLFI